MLRRFSVNFALFSMLLDALSVAFCLWFAAVIRPMLNALPFIKSVAESAVVPASLYLLFPSLWVVIFSALSIYDGRKFLRAADEVAALFLSTFIAAVSSAGILYFSFREVSRALFILFVISTFLLCLLWRVLARIYFRKRPQASTIARRLLVVGAGPLGQGVGKQIRKSRSENLTLVGFVNDGYEARKEEACLGDLQEL